MEMILILIGKVAFIAAIIMLLRFVVRGFGGRK